MDQASIGFPQKGLMFLRGMRLLPPRAGMIHTAGIAALCSEWYYAAAACTPWSALNGKSQTGTFLSHAAFCFFTLANAGL
jgi:hypothetical protein